MSEQFGCMNKQVEIKKRKRRNGGMLDPLEAYDQDFNCSSHGPVVSLVFLLVVFSS